MIHEAPRSNRLLNVICVLLEVFNQLKEYKIKHGDCLVPSRYEENFKLGKWVETQRYEYTKLQRASTPAGEGDESKPGANPRLTTERRLRLEAIGFEWKVKHKMKKYYDRQWDTMFEKLLQFTQVSIELKTQNPRLFANPRLISNSQFRRTATASFPSATLPMLSLALGFTLSASNFVSCQQALTKKMGHRTGKMTHWKLR